MIPLCIQIGLVYKVWLSIPLLGFVRISTILAVISISLYMFWKFKRFWKKAFFQALVAAFFSLILYEIVFNLIAAFIFLRTWDLFIQNLLPWHYLMVGGWIILGLKQAKQSFVLNNTSSTLFLVCLVAWGFWILIGYPYNVVNSKTFSILGETLNVITKTTFLFAYALGLKTDTKLPS